MLLPRLGALLLAANAASAYTQLSPFFLVSSEPLSQNASLKSTQIAKSSDVEEKLVESLSDCSARSYTIYSQRGVSADDFGGKSSGFSRTSKNLRQVKEGAFVDIPQVVVQDVDDERVRERLQAACEARGRRVLGGGAVKDENEVVIEVVTLADLPMEKKKRASVIAEADKELAKYVESVVSAKASKKSVLIYLSTGVSPYDHPSYDMDGSYDSGSMHTDLKRNVYPRQSDDSPNDAQAGLPLFEKYQFLTPGIFMGLFVSFILLMILYVGIKAIAGLDVSYMAFSKEMGPQQQKKLQ